MWDILPSLRLKKLVRKLISFKCVLCAANATQTDFFCEPCYLELPWVNQACVQCAQPVTGSSQCGACQKNPPPFDATFVACDYRFPMPELISRVKFQKQFVTGRILGELLCLQQHKYPVKPDLIIPMPLHVKRLRERQFNQALEIARPLANAWNIPIMPRVCQRIKPTLAQSSLNFQSRQSNIKGAFHTEMSFTHQHVAIVDDVLTTGSTVRELATTLKKAGAAKISVWCVARSLPHH